MERRNLLGWAALALAGLALIVAFGGRFGGSTMAFSQRYTAQSQPAMPARPQAPEAPRFERGRGGPPAVFADELERDVGPRGRGAEGFGRGFGHGRGHGFGPIGMLFGLIGALTKLAALGMLAWLLLRLFQQRRDGPPPPAPTTPAGHDPRVE